MAVCHVRNISANPVSLPYPYKGVVPGGGIILVPDDVPTAVANMGGAAFVETIFDVFPGTTAEQALANPQSIYSILAVTGATTLTTTSNPVVIADTTAGGYTVTLPAASGSAQRVYWIKNGGSGVNNLTVAAVSGNVEGGATRTLGTGTPRGSIMVTSDGTNWFILASAGTIT